MNDVGSPNESVSEKLYAVAVFITHTVAFILGVVFMLGFVLSIMYGVSEMVKEIKQGSTPFCDVNTTFEDGGILHNTSVVG